ncbi:uncharacterized protein TRAVEDRAFT_158942 [Trametes versicolor FP-101664 SS1]|uniref:C2H2-type domain-containing protein n=1 Tax=Trametes pubescens TaxID=154538 RepID=A0A1M2VAV4_TRAPU|nr:uncharacterized protein TRAVEDRAFT_158942 [Trametes versicolor FP-101664 SS1]EIW64543.1 hypothetical protein TRAVEDRAFT_158942 [Trametes versicolor FP-101664 SS1]OJT04771.1 hypothetical protein TRAPUB_4565 [Trametes pubescens]
MSDPTFAQFYPQSAAFEPAAYHKVESAAPPTIALDSGENQKQSFDFFSYSQAGLDVVAPHPDQFELELDNSLAAFDAELSLLPVDTADFSFYRPATPVFGPPSSFTVSSESVSGYDSVYNDSISSRSESYYNFNAQAQSPTNNYPSSVYSLTQEQLDMDFQRMGMPEDPNSFGALPSSPSIRSSPGSVPNISQYSPPYSSPRGSFSDYEPAQPQQVRLGTSAASDYYPQAQVQINKYTGARMVHQQHSRSNSSVSPQLSGVSHPSLAAQRTKIDMHEDPKRKYQCPTCPRAFARAYNLKTHIQTHDPNRLKPYACHHKSCGRSFSRKHDLTRHMVSIHRTESVASLTSSSGHSIGVDGGHRSWCEQCGRSWVGKGKEKGCECDDVK